MENKYLVKLAKTLELRPHQEEALDKLDASGGLILNHKVGSGKSLSFLLAIQKAQKENKTGQSLLIAPAGLISQIDSEIDKHHLKIDRNRLQAYSFEKAVNMSDELGKQKFDITVVDEAHRLRNADTKRAKILSEIVSRSKKRILSTGTSTYNHASDVAGLANMAAGYEVLPVNKKEFESKFIRQVDKPRNLADRILGKPAEKEDVLVNRGKLGEIFKEYAHYYDPSKDPKAKEMFPTVTEETIKVEMSPDQELYYKFLEGKLPFWLKMKVRHGLPLSKQEKVSLNSLSTGIRQVSNTHRHYTHDPDGVEFSPKMQKAVDELDARRKDNKNFKALVHSTFLDSGTNEYSKLLTSKKIPHGVYTGKLTSKEKDVLKNNFNSGKMPVLIISSSGAEGLDLKGVNLVQHIDNHFNKSKGAQVTGRAVRYGSHSHLPKDQQKVHVQHFISTRTKGLIGKPAMSIEEYLNQMGDDKKKIFTEINDIMEKNN